MLAAVAGFLLSLGLPAQDTSTLIKDALKYEGEKISSIIFDPAEQPLPTKQMLDQLPFSPGSVFHSRDLRQALQNLFSTGRFSDLAVDAHQEPDGVALRFVTERAYFVGRVQVLGVRQPPNNGQLLSAAKLRLGTPYNDADKTQAVESLKSILRQNGFYSPVVDVGVDRDAGYEQANVTFNVETGKRAKFERPIIGGNPGRSEDSVIRETHWKRLYGWFGLGWQQATDARLRSGLDNVRRYYEKKYVLDTKVTLNRLDYHTDSNTVQPVIEIQAGQRIAVRVEGAKIGRGKLIQLVPIFQERSVDEDLLVEGEHNIERYLEGNGYFEAEVKHHVTKGKGERAQIVTYLVDRGSRHKFVYLAIEGNRYFTGETIRERLYIEPASLPRFPWGRFNEGYLRQDVQTIRNLYSSNGFRDAKITYRIEDDFRGADNHLGVTIKINEGLQWFVSGLKIEGVGSSDLPLLEAMVASSKNQPYSDISVGADRDNLLNYYYSRGYLSATFDYSVTPGDEPAQVNLRYVINQGPRKYVRDVLISGLETTKRALVLDRIELREGEPLSLSEETDSQRRLYNLGIFARVNTAIQNPDGEEENKYVLYDIDEAKHYSFNVGLGAQIARIGGGSVTSLDNPAGSTGFAPRIALGISRINLFGLGQTLGLQTAVSTIDQRAALTYFIPQLNSNEKLSFTASGVMENSNDIRTYTARRREASIRLGQRLSRAYTLQYGFVFRNVLLSNVKIDTAVIPLLAQPETAGIMSVSLIEDKRDDPTDARHGTYTTLDLSYAPGLLGSQTHFARGLLRNATYHMLGRDFVFARSTQLGVISRTGGKPDVPLAERIYSGGSTSLRSFPDFQAGPRDLTTGFPLGGKALFVNNFELRFPLYGDNLGGVLFQDSGNVYSTLRAVSFRLDQHNQQDFDYMVQSLGFGIRYRTPIGPVRVDLSYSPNAPRFIGLKGTLQDFLSGNPVPITAQKINSFQFHISLGQAF